MIRLIRNEFKKYSKIKFFSSLFILIGVVYLITYLNREENMENIKNTVFTLIPFISVLVCIMFGGIVSQEFQSGTIRAYLTKPYKRSKVLLSKLLFIFINIIILMITSIVSYLVFIKLFKNSLVDINYIKDIIIHFIPVFFVGIITLFLSVATNNTAVSVGISILICFTSNIIAQLLFGFDYDFVQYTFLPYIDFSIFKDYDYILLMENEFNVTLSIKSGSIILLVTSLFLIFLTFNIFNKKDIKN